MALVQIEARIQWELDSRRGGRLISEVGLNSNLKKGRVLTRTMTKGTSLYLALLRALECKIADSRRKRRKFNKRSLMMISLWVQDQTKTLMETNLANRIVLVVSNLKEFK